MTPFEHPAPTNEREFQAFMEALDRHFAELSMPIPGRQLAAIAEVCHALGQQLPVPAPREPREGIYSGQDLILRAISWYDERYGDRLKVYLGPGRSLVIIRGARWAIEYPTVTGRAGFHAGEHSDAPSVLYDSDGKYRPIAPDSTEWLDPTLRRLDVLDFIVGLPPGLRAHLQRGELTGILILFCENRLYLHSLLLARHYRFVEEARADLESTVSHLMSRPAAAGPAKWACMHAVEKVFKSLLGCAGRDYPTHGPNWSCPGGLKR